MTVCEKSDEADRLIDELWRAIHKIEEADKVVRVQHALIRASVSELRALLKEGTFQLRLPLDVA